jgi:hypothetical protein
MHCYQSKCYVNKCVQNPNNCPSGQTCVPVLNNFMCSN